MPRRASLLLHTRYDGLGRLILTIDAEDGETEYAYDAASQLTSVTDALDRVTSYQYDGLGRQTKITQPDPDGGGAGLAPWTTYTYDAVGNVLSMADRLGNTTSYVYDDLYRLTSETDAEAGVTSYTYDAVGNRLTLTDSETNVTTWVYDDLNRVIEETNELSDTRYFEYDAVGNLTQKTDRNEQVTEYVYDNLYRLTDEKWKDGESTIHTFSFTYDAAGQMLTATDSDADCEYDYDGLGRVTSETQTLDGLTPVIVLASQYNANSWLTQLAATIGASDDFVNDYLYDGLGRMTRVTQQDQSGNAVAEKRVDFAYDAASQWGTITRYADVAATDLVATGTYGYDLTGRLTSLTYAKGVTTLVDYDWAFNAGNRMTAMDFVYGGNTYTTDYTSDDTGQLTGADYDYQTDETYTYDDNGNRTISGYVTGDNNQLLADGTYRYVYDDEGNRTLRYVDEDTSGTLNTGDTDITTYDWDYRNRLTTVSHFDAYADYTGEDPDEIVQYAYDYQNRLVRKVLDSDGDGTANSSTIFAYDGGQIAVQFDKSGTGDAAASDLSHRYLWGAAVDQILADEQVTDLETAGDMLWPLVDHLNTARDLATYNSGTDTTTIANHRVFDAFGNITSETNSAVDHIFAFTGRQFDDDTGLQNNLNRWYDPAVGRWLSEDIIGFMAGDENLYRYCRNNPVLYIDPTGLYIYLSKGQSGRWDPVGVIHQDIAVDKWKKDANDCWVKDGIASFSFGVNDQKKRVDYPLQRSWLGWSDATALNVIGIHFEGWRPVVELGLTAGKHMEGEIYPSDFNPKTIVSTLKTTPEEDQKWLKYMEGRLKTRDRYTVLWNNCVNYTNHEYADAVKRFGFK